MILKMTAAAPPSLQEPKAVEREAEQPPSNSPSSEIQREGIQTSHTADLTSTAGIPETTASCEATAGASESAPTPTVGTVKPSPEVMLPSGDAHPAKADRQSRVFILPESYRSIGADICSGYGSLSRTSLHSYWPAKNFQTLPFLRDSYAPAGLSEADHAAASYPTLGGIHPFRPITTMELLREPSRTR